VLVKIQLQSSYVCNNNLCQHYLAMVAGGPTLQRVCLFIIVS
jgi:hypothetical protein